MKSNGWLARAALATALAAMLAACGGSGYGGGTGPGDAPPDARTVVATTSLAFNPTPLTVDAGDRVTFAFRGVAHNVFFDEKAGAPTNIEGQNANKSVARTFATAGTYTYTCHIHPSMHGTVVVREQAP